jgi:hypothetical protein
MPRPPAKLEPFDKASLDERGLVADPQVGLMYCFIEPDPSRSKHCLGGADCKSYILGPGVQIWAAVCNTGRATQVSDSGLDMALDDKKTKTNIPVIP